MTIYRSVKTLITKTRKTRTFFTAATISSYPLSLHSLHYCYCYYPPSSPSPSPRFLSPLSKWIAPFDGPLFLSSPPWKLSQSATPLYLRGNGVSLQRVEAFNFNLLRSRIGSSGSVNNGVVWHHHHHCDDNRLQELKEDGAKDGFVGSFVNLPNFISLSRLVSGPLIGWMITNEMYSAAFVGLALAGATDWLDGYIARTLRINSVLGSYLDPLADKVLIGSVALAMVHMDLLHPGLVGLVVMRDVALVGGAIYHRASNLGWKWSSWYDFFNVDGTRPEKVEPLFISKVNTVLQLVLVAAALLQPGFGTEETRSYITSLSWLVACTTASSTAAYGAQYMGNRSTLLARKL